MKENICYIEIKVICFLKQNITRKNANYVIGTSINQAMFLDENLKGLHKKSGFKFYSFDSFYPLSDKNGIYNKDSIYMFRLRSLDKSFSNTIANILKKFQNEYFSVIAVEKNIRAKKIIESLITLTPIIITEKGSRGIKNNIMESCTPDAILANLIKKYNSFYNKNISLEDVGDMFLLSQITSKPLGMNYKQIKLIGLKYNFNIAQNSLAQDLAFFAEAVGLGEKTSAIGAGFCHAVYF